MSLYRQSSGSGWRWIAGAAVVALLIGAGLGYALGRSTAPEPTIEEQVSELQVRLQPTLDGLALVPGHYSQGVREGGSVQYEGSVQQATAAEDGFAAEAGELQSLNPVGYEAAEQKLEALLAAIDDRAPPSEVADLADEARKAVAAAAGIGGS